MTRDLENRVVKQQGYNWNEFEVLYEDKDINIISKKELKLQKQYGYRIDDEPYNKLKCNNMRINVTEQTATFPCPLNKLKGQLLDNIGLRWETEHGDFSLTNNTVKWILSNAITSKYNNDRCYIYNKAFARYYDNNDAHSLADLHQENKITTGGLFPVGADHRVEKEILNPTHFDLIRDWAEKRGLYEKGDPKTQTLKLMEEAGEICRAVLKKDEEQIFDGIGDCVVVLTNLAHLCDVSIEECIEAAYDEIKDRTGKMDNGTFKKD